MKAEPVPFARDPERAIRSEAFLPARSICMEVPEFQVRFPAEKFPVPDPGASTPELSIASPMVAFPENKPPANTKLPAAIRPLRITSPLDTTRLPLKVWFREELWKSSVPLPALVTVPFPNSEEFDPKEIVPSLAKKVALWLTETPINPFAAVEIPLMERFDPGVLERVELFEMVIFVVPFALFG